jgi:hypothetical protein
MKTKSLRVVALELSRLWANGSAPTLYRVGENQFLIAEEPPSGTYLYGLGFSIAGELKDDGANNRLPTGRDRGRRTTFLVVVAGSLVLALALALLGLGVFPGQTIGQRSGLATSKASVNAPKQSRECSPKLSDFKPQSTSLAISELRVGGVREQVQAVTCSGATKYYRVRFYLDAETWKTESAAPVGPHFQN